MRIFGGWVERGESTSARVRARSHRRRALWCSGLFAVFAALAAAFALPVLSAGSRQPAVRTPGADQKVSPNGKLPRGAVEMPGRRTSTSRTWRLASGEKVTRVYAQPVNKPAGKTWATLDNALIRSSVAGFAFRNRRDNYTVRLPRQAAGPVRVQRGGDRVRFELRKASDTAGGRVAGNTVTYADALRGVDLGYEATTEGLRETLRLATPNAPTAYSYRITLSNGLKVAEGASGQLEIKKRGKTVFSFEAPIVYDAAGEKAEGPGGRPLRYSLARRGNSAIVGLRFSRRWLAAPTRKFPVTVDPTISYVNGSAVLNGAVQDTFIQSNTPDANYNASTFLQVGWSGSPAHEQRALLKFDVNGAVPQDSVVYSAQLSAYRESAANANPANVVVREMGRSWSEAATWNRYDGASSWTTPGGQTAGFASGGIVPTQGWNQWLDLQPLAQRWVDGTTVNNGLMLAASSASPANDYRFTASNGTSAQVPYLQVRYDERYGTSERYQFWHPDGTVDAGAQPDFEGATGMPPVSVNVANGNLLLNTLDRPYSESAPGLHPVSRSYNSVWWGQWSHGLGWTANSSPDYSLKPNADGSVAFVGPSLPPVRFAKIAGGYAPSLEADATLTTAPDGSGEYYVTFNETGERFIFKGLNYVAKAWIDSGGTRWNYIYTVDGAGKPTTFTATAEGQTGWTKWYFDPNVSGRRTSKIETSDGKTYQYGYDSSNNLTTYTAPDNTITRYEYDTGTDAATPRRLTKITAPDGSQTKFTYTGPWGRRQVATYTTRAAGASTDGPTWRFSYGNGDTTITSPSGTTTSYTWDRSNRATGSVTGANPPTISLSGSLFANRETALNGDTYNLSIDARDGSTGAPSQGIKSVEVLLDDERADYAEQTCPGGSCALARTYTLRTDDSAQGVHVVTVKVTDLGGAVRTQTFTINVDHSDTEDPFAAPAGAAGRSDDGPLLADDPTNPPDEGDGQLAEALTCAGGDSAIEQHELTDGASFATAQAAFSDYMTLPDNTAMPASAFTLTRNEPTAATYSARQSANTVGVVTLHADSAGKWEVEGLAACGAFAGEPRSTTRPTASATPGCPTPTSASRQFYESVYCRAFQDVDFYFSSSFPKGRRRDRVVEGARAWNAAPGSLFFRSHRKTDLPAGGSRCSRRPAGGTEDVGVISWGPIDGPRKKLARAGACFFTGADGKPDQAVSFAMRFDSAESWYYRNRRGKPKSSQSDLRSVATHEMGHATGWGPHFDDKKRKSYCGDVSYQQTMCSITYRGSTRQRSLGARDVRVFRGAYGR